MTIITRFARPPPSTLNLPPPPSPPLNGNGFQHPTFRPEAYTPTLKNVASSKMKFNTSTFGKFICPFQFVFGSAYHRRVFFQLIAFELGNLKAILVIPISSTSFTMYVWLLHSRNLVFGLVFTQHITFSVHV